MVNAYVQRTGKPEEEIRAILKQETYLNATDAVAMGFCNRITEKPITGRVFARLDNVPHGVVSALFGAGSDGNQEPPHKGKPMSDSAPVAATLQEIKAAFPKAKSDFIVKCLERSLPMASVAQAAVEEMMAENQEMAAKCKAMEEELAKYKSMEHPEEEMPAEAMEDEEEELVESKATARGGVKPIAKAKTGGPSARVRWDEAVTQCLAKCGGNVVKAVALANRTNPGLRQAYLDEVNS
jgi:hypothetical protein